MPSDGDITCREFSRFLAKKSAHYSYSDRYIAEVRDSKDKTGSTEREHMVIWFSANETRGGGAYTRQSPNVSAKRCYNRLNNAASLLWIAEAVGIDESTVAAAFEAAKAAGDYRRACGAVRKLIPWEAVFERAFRRQGETISHADPPEPLAWAKPPRQGND